MALNPIPIEYTRGEQPFESSKAAVDLSLLDFWAWAYSDVLTNTARGVLAEFIVATALGLDIRVPRSDWDKFDLSYMGHGVEVKSASYHQRWFQKKMSIISFGTPKRRAWDANTNRLDEEARRQSDIYVLALLAEKDRSEVNPLNLDQWNFWVVETTFFDERKRSQHSISYNSLIKERGEPIGYHEIKPSVDDVINKLA